MMDSSNSDLLETSLDWCSDLSGGRFHTSSTTSPTHHPPSTLTPTPPNETQASLTPSILQKLTESTSSTSSVKSIQLFSTTTDDDELTSSALPITFSTDSLDRLQSLYTRKDVYKIVFDMNSGGGGQGEQLSKGEKDYVNQKDCFGRGGGVVNLNEVVDSNRSSHIPSIPPPPSSTIYRYPNKTQPNLLQPNHPHRNHRRPLSLNDLEQLRSRVHDWPSLELLLPHDIKKLFQLKPEKRFSLKDEIIFEQNDLDLSLIKDELNQNLEKWDRVGRLFCEKTSSKTSTSNSSRTDSSQNSDSSTSQISPLLSSIEQLLTNPQQLIKSTTSQTLYQSFIPNLYSLLSDGLKPMLSTLFGLIPNTLWRVVESSVQYGPSTVNIQELLMRINVEESCEEGPMRFSSFVCGLLNLQLLPSWLTFLRTKERLIRSHYNSTSFMYLSSTRTRHTYDQLLTSLLQLQMKYKFQLDIFWETKLMLREMKRAPTAVGSRSKSAAPSQSTSAKPNKNQQRSVKSGSQPQRKFGQKLKAQQSLMKRSFSDERPKNVPVQPVLNKNIKPRINSEESIIEKGILETRLEDKFKKLRLQWELFSGVGGGGGGGGGSKIPRLISWK